MSGEKYYKVTYEMLTVAVFGCWNYGRFLFFKFYL